MKPIFVSVTAFTLKIFPKVLLIGCLFLPGPFFEFYTNKGPIQKTNVTQFYPNQRF